MGSGTGHAQHTATPAVPVRTLRRSRSSGSLSACRPEPSLLPSRTHRSEGRAFSSAFKTKPHKNIRRQGVGGGLWAVKGAPREKSRRVYRLTVEARVHAGPGSATQPRERARVPHPHRGSRQAAGRRPLACPPYTPLWGRVSPVSPGLPSWPRSGVPMTKTEPARRGARCAPEPGRGLRGADARCGHAAVTASQGPSRLLSFRLHSLQLSPRSCPLGVQKDLPGGPRCHTSRSATPGPGPRACQLLLDRELRSPSAHTRRKPRREKPTRSPHKEHRAPACAGSVTAALASMGEASDATAGPERS